MINTDCSKRRSKVKPFLSIIIVSYKVKELLKNCLNSLLAHPPRVSFETIIVDNNSGDSTIAMLKDSFPWAKVIANGANLGFAKANNIGIKASRGEFVLLLNPDTVVLPNTLDKMLSFMRAHPDVGVCGCRIVDQDGNIQPSCGRFPTPKLVVPHLFGLHKRISKVRSFYMSDWNHASNRIVDWVCAACFLTRRKIIDSIGLLEENLFLYGEEMDWCSRMSAEKWKTAYYSESAIIHYGGESISQIKKTRVLDRTNYMLLYVSLYHYLSKFYGKSTTNTVRFMITILIFLNVPLTFFSAFIRPKNSTIRLRRSVSLLRIAFMNMHILKY